MNLLVLALLCLSVLCVVCGLWVGYRGRQRREAVSAPPDEEILIFDRVTEGLSMIPDLSDPAAVWTAHKEVMQRVGEQYGLKSAEVGTIYWRIWRWKHGPAR